MKKLNIKSLIFITVGFFVLKTPLIPPIQPPTDSPSIEEPVVSPQNDDKEPDETKT